jgi:hypothetical protein
MVRWLWLRRFTLFVILIIWYFLSVGPVDWLVLEGYGVPAVVVEVAYYPLWFVRDHSTKGAGLIDRYLSVWVAVPNPDFEDVPPEVPRSDQMETD